MGALNGNDDFTRESRTATQSYPICRFTYNQPPFYKYLTSSFAIPSTYFPPCNAFLFLFLFFFIFTFFSRWKRRSSRNYSRKDKKLLLLVVGVESREFVCSRVLINSRVALEELMDVWKEKKVQILQKENRVEKFGRWKFWTDKNRYAICKPLASRDSIIS